MPSTGASASARSSAENSTEEDGTPAGEEEEAEGADSLLPPAEEGAGEAPSMSVATTSLTTRLRPSTDRTQMACGDITSVDIWMWNGKGYNISRLTPG